MIFSGFLFLVISVSYISYKIKGGRNQIRTSQQMAPAPIISAKPVRVVPSVPVVKKQILPSYDINKPVRKFNTQLNSETRKDFSINEQRQPVKENNYNTVKHHSLQKNTMALTRATRIEILNTSEKNNHPLTVEFPIRTIKNSQNLSDANILNYYSDRNDRGFVSLRAV